MHAVNADELCLLILAVFTRGSGTCTYCIGRVRYSAEKLNALSVKSIMIKLHFIVRGIKKTNNMNKDTALNEISVHSTPN